MTALVLPWVIVAFSMAMLLNAWRLLRGPTLADRIIALDALYVNAIASIVLLGIRYDNAHCFEVALLVAMLGFVGTLALTKFTLRGDPLE